MYPTKSKCATRLVMSLVEPQEDWEECNVEFLHSYKTYNQARKAAILASEDKVIGSNIETDYEKPRKRQIPARYTHSSDDDSESEHKRKKCKGQITERSRQEIQRAENEEHEKYHNISQINSVPAPAVNIREQLAALKVKLSNSRKTSKCNTDISNTNKFLTTNESMKAKNYKVSPEKSIRSVKVSPEKSVPKDSLMSYRKSPANRGSANVTNVPGQFQSIDLYASTNFSTSSLDTDEILCASQSSSISTFSPILHELDPQREQMTINLNSEECNENNIMQNFKKLWCAQEVFDKKKNSTTTDNVKSFLEGNTDITWTEIIENFVKVEEEIRVKLEHLEMKLDRILNKLFPDEIKLNRPHGIPAFPLRTQEEWDRMETILADDDAFTYVVDLLIAKMKKQKSEITAVQCVLPKVITNSLSRCISWRGSQKSKIAFNKSKMYEAIQAAILQMFGTTVNLQKPEEYVKRWFSTSAQRVV